MLQKRNGFFRSGAIRCADVSIAALGPRLFWHGTPEAHVF
jgi:hypothetical protein